MRLKAVLTTIVGASALALGTGVALAGSWILDPGFGSGGAATIDLGGREFAAGLAMQPDGKIVVAGATESEARVEAAIVARLDADGRPDASFDGDGIARIDQAELGGAHVALLPDGKMIVTGFKHGVNANNAAIYRLNPDGSLDITFGSGGEATVPGTFNGASALAIAPDLKIVLAAWVDGKAVLYRRNADGTPDLTFGTGGRFEIVAAGEQTPTAVAVQPDGKIVLAGYSRADAGTFDAVVYRITAGGAMDPAFANSGTRIIDGGQNEEGHALALQSDGRIVVAGRTRAGAESDAVVYRLLPDGRSDPTFDGDGAAILGAAGDREQIEAIALQPDGRIVLAGVTSNGASRRVLVYRLQADGARDATFDADGELRTDAGGLDGTSAVVSQPDGKIVLAGGDDRDGVVLRLLDAGDPPPATPPSDAATPPAPAPAPPSPGPTADTLAPRITGVAYARSRLRFSLSEPADVRIAVERALPGRRVGGRCTAPTRRTASRRRCTRLRPARTIARPRLPGGATTIRIDTRKLRPGRYRVSITATDRAGNRSAPARAAFTTARSPRGAM